MRQYLQGTEVQHDAVVVTGLVSYCERDVLLGGSDQDGLIDQLHRFLPDRVLDLVSAESEDTVTCQLPTLIHLEGFVDYSLEIITGVSGPGFDALVYLLLGELQFNTELNLLSEAHLNAILLIKADEQGIALPFEAISASSIVQIVLDDLDHFLFVR